jgi:hypothetical protein
VGKLSEAETKELHLLADWISYAVDFMLKSGPIHAEFRTVIDQALKRNDLKGMKMVGKDMKEWIRGLDGAGKKNLEQALADRFGVRFDEIKEAKIREIILSDKIRNKTEFSTLFEYVETHYEDAEKKELIDQINILLARYEGQYR